MEKGINFSNLNFENESELVRFCEDYRRNKEEYNGWSNYATWRVKLELWDNFSLDSLDESFDDIYIFSEYIKEQTDEMLELSNMDLDKTVSLVHDYAMAFVSDVNWYEIAESIAESYPEVIRSKETV